MVFIHFVGFVLLENMKIQKRRMKLLYNAFRTDYLYRETSNTYDFSRFITDMTKQNVISDSLKRATWVSIHNIEVALVVKKWLITDLACLLMSITE